MPGIRQPGGIGTYIRRISNSQIESGHTVKYLDCWDGIENGTPSLSVVVIDESELLIHAQKLDLDILHLHTDVSVLPKKYCIPIIRTIHNNNPYCPSGSRYLKRWGKPCDRAYSVGGCLWGHLADNCGSIRPQRFYRGLKRVWQEMDNLSHFPAIANSQFVKDQMIRSGYSADNVSVLHLPAPDIREYFPPNKEDLPHFLFLGRIAPEKGLNWLLHALAEVKVEVRIDIAGSGNQRQEQEIRHLAERLGLNQMIMFHGWVDETKAIQLLQKARVLVFPSVWHEPAGLVTLEAAAVGRAVIASRVGGIPEYASRLQNALLIEPNDVSELAQNIEQLATNWSLAEQMGIKGRKMAQQHFSLDNHLRELLRLYELAIN